MRAWSDLAGGTAYDTVWTVVRAPSAAAATLGMEVLITSLDDEGPTAQHERGRAAAADRYADLFEHTLLGICISSPSGSLMACNPSFANMLGFASVEEAIGSDMASLYDDATDRAEFLIELRRLRRLERYHTALRRRDGRLIHVIASVVGHFDADGDLREIHGYLLDDTASVEAETALRERDQLFRAVFSDATDAILLLDDLRLVVEANPAAGRLFGRPAQTLVGESLDDLIPEPGASWTSAWSELLTVGEAKREHQVPSPGGLQLVECSYRARVHAGRHLCIGRNITERRVLHERLAHAARIESVGRLAGGIAHDFNNLLTTILGYTELLLMRRDPHDPERDDLEEIQAAGKRAAVLTHQLLAFGRKQMLQPRELDLNHTISGIQPVLRDALREDITLTVALSATPALVMFDANQIEQVILNLVLNSRDALPMGGTIEIDVSHITLSSADIPADRAESAGSHVRLRVIDNGTGIPANVRAHLFEPFFTTKEQGKGTGLGLAAVYGIVHQSGGFIVLDSPPSGGTMFSLYFPAVAPARIAPPAAALAGSEKILLVEDEDAVRIIISALLCRNGYHVFEAATPGAALEIFEHHAGDIDLLLTDVVMPEMNGPALAQRCVLKKPSLRVLFISGYAADTLPAAMLGPSVRFLAKPFQATALTREVRDLLDQPADQRPV